MIVLENVTKTYRVGRKNTQHVLNELDLEVREKNSIAIEGRSGSGKTTLLNIIAGIDINFTGNYQFDSIDIKSLSPSERAKFRQKKIGIITQQFDLLEDRNVYQNILLAISHEKLTHSDRKKRVSEALQYVGLSGYEKKRINQHLVEKCNVLGLHVR